MGYLRRLQRYMCCACIAARMPVTDSIRVRTAGWNVQDTYSCNTPPCGGVTTGVYSRLRACARPCFINELAKGVR